MEDRRRARRAPRARRLLDDREHLRVDRGDNASGSPKDPETGAHLSSRRRAARRRTRLPAAGRWPARSRRSATAARTASTAGRVARAIERGPEADRRPDHAAATWRATTRRCAAPCGSTSRARRSSRRPRPRRARCSPRWRCWPQRVGPDKLRAARRRVGAHWLAEIEKRAFRDRNRYLGDPDFGGVDEKLLHRPGPRPKLVAPRSTRTAPRPPTQLGRGDREKPTTTHFSVVDAAGHRRRR